MAREIFFSRNQPNLDLIEAAINFDELRDHRFSHGQHVADE